jgi:hypothetical protein
MKTTGYWIEEKYNKPSAREYACGARHWVYLNNKSNEHTQKLELIKEGRYYVVSLRAKTIIDSMPWVNTCANEYFLRLSDAQKQFNSRKRWLISHRDRMNKALGNKAYETQGVEL